MPRRHPRVPPQRRQSTRQSPQWADRKRCLAIRSGPRPHEGLNSTKVCAQGPPFIHVCSYQEGLQGLTAFFGQLLCMVGVDLTWHPLKGEPLMSRSASPAESRPNRSTPGPARPDQKSTWKLFVFFLSHPWIGCSAGTCGLRASFRLLQAPAEGFHGKVRGVSKVPHSWYEMAARSL